MTNNRNKSYLRVLIFDVAEFADTIVLTHAKGGRSPHFYLKGTISTARAATGATMIAESENTKGFVTELTIILVLLLLLFWECIHW